MKQKQTYIIGEVFFLYFLFSSFYAPSITWAGICQTWHIFAPVWIIFGAWILRHQIIQKYSQRKNSKEMKKFLSNNSTGQKSGQLLEGIHGETFQHFWNKTEKITRSTIEKFFDISRSRAEKIIKKCFQEKLLSRGGINNSLKKESKNTSPLFTPKNFFPIHRTLGTPLQ